MWQENEPRAPSTGKALHAGWGEGCHTELPTWMKGRMQGYAAPDNRDNEGASYGGRGMWRAPGMKGGIAAGP